MERLLCDEKSLAAKTEVKVFFFSFLPFLSLLYLYMERLFTVKGCLNSALFCCAIKGLNHVVLYPKYARNELPQPGGHCS